MAAKNKGYLWDWRKELDSAVWQKPPLFYKVWRYLLKRASYEDQEFLLNNGQVIVIKRGQHLTTMRNIAEGVSWLERNKKVIPHPQQIRRIIQWFEAQVMITTEKIVISAGTQLPDWVCDGVCDRGSDTAKNLVCDTVVTLITVVNYNKYQSQKNEVVTPQKYGVVTGVQTPSVTRVRKSLKNNISCATLESLRGLLASLPDFCELPEKTQRLALAFLDKKRLSNKSKQISSGKVQTLLNDLTAISGETSPECLCTGLEITQDREERGDFTFGKRNDTGYVRAIAKSKHQQTQKAMNEKYEPQETDTEALYGRQHF
jgi:hypothetical protein